MRRHQGGGRPPALDAILAGLRAEPSRIGSLVVTVFGDAVVPRGGSLWLGTLLAVFRALGTEDGAVRTAMSRLTADGWLERRRVGRNSFYRLAEPGRSTFARATRHIYHLSPPAWDGGFHMVLPADGSGRPDLVESLLEAGFGTVQPGLFVAPRGVPVPRLGPGDVRLDALADDPAAASLAARAWPLERTAESYRRFLAAFQPLGDELAAGLRLPDLDAFVARILMIHAYRRVILRDPILPTEILPAGWPGHVARALCAELYGRLLPASEAWLDRHGLDEDGPLPQPGPELGRRFS